MLRRLSLGNKSSTEHATFGSWAEGKGAKVTHQLRLSFQQDAFAELSRFPSSQQ